MREDMREVERGEDVEKAHPIETPSERVRTEKPKEIPAEHASPPMKPYKPPVPYP